MVTAPARPPSTPPHAPQVQLGDKLALVREGRVVHVLATAHSSLFPRVAALRPLAAEPAADGVVEVSVWGHNLDNEADTLLARTNGGRWRRRQPGAGLRALPTPPLALSVLSPVSRVAPYFTPLYPTHSLCVPSHRLVPGGGAGAAGG